MSSSHGLRGTQVLRLGSYLGLSWEYSDAPTVDSVRMIYQEARSFTQNRSDRAGATNVALLCLLSSGVHSTFASSSDSHGEHPAAAPHCLTPETGEFRVRLKRMLQVW